MIDQIDVTGTNAFNFLRGKFGSGKTLSVLLGEQPLENGRIIAFVPKLTSGEKVFAFDSGGLYVPNQVIRENGMIVESVENDARPVIQKAIGEFLARDEMHCCLFEDVLSEPFDLALKNSKLEFLTIGNEVLFFINNHKWTSELVEKALLFSESQLFLCALSQMDLKSQDGFDPAFELDINLLRQFVANISSFVVMAYDGEGYLMWKK